MKKIKIKKRTPRIQKNQIRIKIQKNLKIESSLKHILRISNTT